MSGPDEKWLPIPGYEGMYEVSNFGAVRSLRRETLDANGKRHSMRGKYLNINVIEKGYHQVALYRDGHRKYHKVHRLVLEAFVGPPDSPDLHGMHINDVPGDNRAENLRWGTASENIADQIAHGHHWATMVTHCPQGHPYSGDNLVIAKRTGQRCCRECGRTRSREYQRRKRAERVA